MLGGRSQPRFRRRTFSKLAKYLQVTSSSRQVAVPSAFTRSRALPISSSSEAGLEPGSQRSLWTATGPQSGPTWAFLSGSAGLNLPAHSIAPSPGPLLGLLRRGWSPGTWLNCCPPVSGKLVASPWALVSPCGRKQLFQESSWTGSCGSPFWPITYECPLVL